MGGRSEPGARQASSKNHPRELPYCPGVYFHKQSQKYYITVVIDKIKYRHGMFKDRKSAISYGASSIIHLVNAYPNSRKAANTLKAFQHAEATYDEVQESKELLQSINDEINNSEINNLMLQVMTPLIFSRSNSVPLILPGEELRAYEVRSPSLDI